ncbi:diguanylate cyclase [Anaerolineales bacterium HSG24]|nr:diguanylate cyclase [Anaerolineales bacterium HSG24]
MTTKDIILIIDDNIANIKLVLDTLNAYGFEIVTALNGTMGIRRAKFVKPDLILLDIMMPDISGFETCRQLKADDEVKDIPIIFMTALSNVTDKLKGFKMGGVDYITKPIEVAELLARVKTHLTIHRLQKELMARNQELQRLNKELARLAHIDGLTQLANRRHFDTYLSQTWQRISHEQGDLSLILLDLDYFKAYNDSYGHLTGDDCLKRVAQRLQEVIRHPTDLVARYGGEEFALVLPRTNGQEASQLAQRIQTELSQLQIPHVRSTVNPYVTCSMGIASTIPQENFPSAIELIDRADQALYQAKEQGRNRIVLFNDG